MLQSRGTPHIPSPPVREGVLEFPSSVLPSRALSLSLFLAPQAPPLSFPLSLTASLPPAPSFTHKKRAPQAYPQGTRLGDQVLKLKIYKERTHTHTHTHTHSTHAHPSAHYSIPVRTRARAHVQALQTRHFLSTPVLASLSLTCACWPCSAASAAASAQATALLTTRSLCVAISPLLVWRRKLRRLMLRRWCPCPWPLPHTWPGGVSPRREPGCVSCGLGGMHGTSAPAGVRSLGRIAAGRAAAASAGAGRTEAHRGNQRKRNQRERGCAPHRLVAAFGSP